MLLRIAERYLETKYGVFTEVTYYDGQKETIALVMGIVAGQKNVLCRVHSSCISAHAFNSTECDCREQMAMAQSLIRQAGAGIVVWLEQEGRGNGHMALARSNVLKKKEGLSQTEAYKRLGFEGDARNYRAAAEILRDLSVESVILLTNSPQKVNGLRDHGTVVVGFYPIAIDPTGNEMLMRSYRDKIRQGHHIVLQERYTTK